MIDRVTKMVDGCLMEYDRETLLWAPWVPSQADKRRFKESTRIETQKTHARLKSMVDKCIANDQPREPYKMRSLEYIRITQENDKEPVKSILIKHEAFKAAARARSAESGVSWYLINNKLTKVEK